MEKKLYDLPDSRAAYTIRYVVLDQKGNGDDHQHPRDLRTAQDVLYRSLHGHHVLSYPLQLPATHGQGCGPGHPHGPCSGASIHEELYQVSIKIRQIDTSIMIMIMH